MKKIAILTKHMNMGGIPKVLISMLEELVKEDYEIDLYLLEREGSLLDKIPKKVNIKDMYGEERVVKRVKSIYKDYGKLKAIKVFINYLLMYIFRKENENLLSNVIPEIKNEYDIAISYNFLYSFGVRCTIEKIKASQKYLWVHSQASIFKNTGYREKVEKYEVFFSKFDKIFCVSEDVKKDFDSTYSNLAKKTNVFYNLINEEEIKLLAKEEKKIKFSKKRNILTVGRLSEEKGQLRIIEIVEKLLKKNYDFVWYLIGDGILREKLETEIKNRNLYGKIKILGQISNPYPYINAVDIYVQPSISEGYCTTILEAKILEKPIVATNFSGISEQIINNETGLIVENSINGLVNGIEKLLLDNRLGSKFITNLKKEIRDKKIQKLEF